MNFIFMVKMEFFGHSSEARITTFEVVRSICVVVSPSFLRSHVHSPFIQIRTGSRFWKPTPW